MVRIFRILFITPAVRSHQYPSVWFTRFLCTFLSFWFQINPATWSSDPFWRLTSVNFYLQVFALTLWLFSSLYIYIIYIYYILYIYIYINSPLTFKSSPRLDHFTTTSLVRSSNACLIACVLVCFAQVKGHPSFCYPQTLYFFIDWTF